MKDEPVAFAGEVPSPADRGTKGGCRVPELTGSLRLRPRTLASWGRPPPSLGCTYREAALPPTSAPDPQTPQAGLAQEEGLLRHLWPPKPPVSAGTGVRREEHRAQGQVHGHPHPAGVREAREGGVSGPREGAELLPVPQVSLCLSM